MARSEADEWGGDTKWESLLRALAWALGGAAGILTLAIMIAAIVGAVENPGQSHHPWPWLRPSATLTAFTCIALWGVSLVAAWYPRRYERRSWQLVGIGGFALLAVLMGLAATAPCNGPNDDVVLTPMWHTMVLFVGTSPSVFESGGDCYLGGSGEDILLPLAAQGARFAALAAVFGAAIAVALKVGQQQWSRLQARFQGLTDIVIGIDEPSMPLVKALVDWRQKGRGVALLALEWQGPFAEQARQLGARAFTVRSKSNKPVDGKAPRTVLRERDLAQLVTSLRPYLVRRAGRVLPFGKPRAAADNIWVMEPDLDLAILISDAVVKVMADVPGAADTRIVVRCDDPVVAHKLRASWIEPRLSVGLPQKPWRDAVSSVSVTAIEIVGRVGRAMREAGFCAQDALTTVESTEPQPTYVMLICGDTPLAEAVGSEVRLRAWEEYDLLKAWKQSSGHGPGDEDPEDLLVGANLPSRLIFVDEAASAMEANWRSRDQLTSRLMPQVGVLEMDWRQITTETLGRLQIDPGMPVVVILTNELAASERHIAARISIQMGSARTRVWHQPYPGDAYDSVDNAEAELGMPSSVGVKVYRPDILLDGRIPEDSWTRVARHRHEVYRRRHWDPSNPRRRPWWHSAPDKGLDQDTRTDNVRLLKLALSGALEGPPGTRTWRWDPSVGQVPPPSPITVERLARIEHQRWMEQRIHDEVKKGHTRDAAVQSHADLVTFSELDAASKNKSREGVREVLLHLMALGYSLSRG